MATARLFSAPALLAGLLGLALTALADDAVSVDAGIHSRIRETYVGNAPGLPNGGDAVPVSKVRKDTTQGIRVDSYPWVNAKWREYTVLFGLGHSFIEYLDGVDAPHHERSYRLPDILYLNNLYLDGRGSP